MYDLVRCGCPVYNIPPAEYEMMYYQQIEESAKVAWLKQKSLRNTRGGSLTLCFLFILLKKERDRYVAQ